jgi:hypothetical protein
MCSWASTPRNRASTWQTVATGAPNAAGDPFSYPFNSQGTQHVNYLGGDGHVHELWWDAAGWQHNDLTVATGAPTSASNPHGYVFVALNTQHVNYCGTDGHIHELWWNSAGWNHNDLTIASGAGNGTNDPVGYMFSAQGTQHINYLGSDWQIHELWCPEGYLLPFQVEPQQESEWCWAAVSTSIAHYYLPTSAVTQCQVVNQQFGRTDRCINPSSSNCNPAGGGSLSQALQYVGHSNSEEGQGSYEDLSSSLAAATPPCIRIGWSGGGGHFIGVYGCEIPDMVLVTDPIYHESLVSISTLTGGSYEGNGTWTNTYFTQA